MPFNVDLSLPDDFDHCVRLFPLPNLVLFPGVMQGLHIFEPRYRELMTDALASDQLITMAVLKPNSTQSSFELRPEIYPTVCIGKIVTHSRTEDGRFNLLLVGIRRARVVEEVILDHGYRSAKVELIEDLLDADESEVAALRKRLVQSFLKYAKQRQGLGQESIKNMLVDSMPFGLMVDLICYAVGLSIPDQVQILQTARADERCRRVLEMIDDMQDSQVISDGNPETRQDFPPDFSLN